MEPQDTRYFPLGTRVKIKIDSEFANQTKAWGTIVLDDNDEAYEDVDGSWQSKEWQRWQKVEFDDGYSNNYRYKDLYAESYANNQEAVSLLSKEY
jgi:hypothetical protein